MSRFPIVYSFAINATSRPPCLVIISSLSASLLNFKVNLLQRNKGKPISILYSCKGNTHVSTWPMTLVILGKTWWIYLMDSTASEGGWVAEGVWPQFAQIPWSFKASTDARLTWLLSWSKHITRKDHCISSLETQPGIRLRTKLEKCSTKKPKTIIWSAGVLKAFNQGHKSGISVEASSQ